MVMDNPECCCAMLALSTKSRKNMCMAKDKKVEVEKVVNAIIASLTQALDPVVEDHAV